MKLKLEIKQVGESDYQILFENRVVGGFYIIEEADPKQTQQRVIIRNIAGDIAIAPNSLEAVASQFEK